MARPLVLDASAALGVLLREPGADEAHARITDAEPGGLLVPAHFWLEVGNVLVRRYRLSVDDVVGVLRDLDDLGLETVDLDRPSLLLSLDLMALHLLTTYDAGYLALAEIADADLLTLDRQLAMAAGPRSVIRQGPAAHEDRPAYGSPPFTAAPVDWTRHGRYLADLRRAAAS